MLLPAGQQWVMITHRWRGVPRMHHNCQLRAVARRI
jgi:hypothetical protein